MHTFSEEPKAITIRTENTIAYPSNLVAMSLTQTYLFFALSFASATLSHAAPGTFANDDSAYQFRLKLGELESTLRISGKTEYVCTRFVHLLAMLYNTPIEWLNPDQTVAQNLLKRAYEELSNKDTNYLRTIKGCIDSGADIVSIPPFKEHEFESTCSKENSLINKLHVDNANFKLQVSQLHHDLDASKDKIDKLIKLAEGLIQEHQDMLYAWNELNELSESASADISRKLIEINTANQMAGQWNQQLTTVTDQAQQLVQGMIKVKTHAQALQELKKI